MKKFAWFLCAALFAVPLLAQVTGPVASRFPIKKLLFGINISGKPLPVNAVYVTGLPDTMPAMITEVTGVDTSVIGGTIVSIADVVTWLDGSVVRYTERDTFPWRDAQIILPKHFGPTFPDSIFYVEIDTLLPGNKFQVMLRIYGTAVSTTIFDTLQTK